MDPNSNNLNFLQSLLSSSSSSSSSSSMDPSMDMDPMFSGISLQTLLNINPSLPFLTDHPPPPPSQPQKPLLMPKIEHPHHHQYPYLINPQSLPQLEQQPFNFFPKRPRFDYSTTWYPSTATTTAAYSSPDTSSSSSSPSFRAKQPRSSSPSSSPPVIPQSNLARQRRQKLSEKTRCLQKLMPWDKKMDQATLLEEAYKYVKFLQAQVTVLQSMPPFTVANSPPQQRNNNNNDGGNGGGGGVVFGELERLSRNQVLQVMVNSPVAQTVLSSQGLCVFSVEQLGSLKQLSERRLIFQHMNSRNNNNNNININMNMVSDSKPNFFN